MQPFPKTCQSDYLQMLILTDIYSFMHLSMDFGLLEKGGTKRSKLEIYCGIGKTTRRETFTNLIRKNKIKRGGYFSAKRN